MWSSRPASAGAVTPSKYSHSSQIVRRRAGSPPDSLPPHRPSPADWPQTARTADAEPRKRGARDRIRRHISICTVSVPPPERGLEDFRRDVTELTVRVEVNEEVEHAATGRRRHFDIGRTCPAISRSPKWHAVLVAAIACGHGITLAIGLRIDGAAQIRSADEVARPEVGPQGGVGGVRRVTEISQWGSSL